LLLLFEEDTDARDDAKDAFEAEDCTLFEDFVFGFGLWRTNLGDA